MAASAIWASASHRCRHASSTCWRRRGATMSDSGGSDPGGRMDGALHRLPIRVYHAYTAAGGLVFHANYLRLAERGRTEMLRTLGSSHGNLLESEGVTFAVRRCEIDFRWPARLDDLLEVETRIVD